MILLVIFLKDLQVEEGIQMVHSMLCAWFAQNRGQSGNGEDTQSEGEGGQAPKQARKRRRSLENRNFGACLRLTNVRVYRGLRAGKCRDTSLSCLQGIFNDGFHMYFGLYFVWSILVKHVLNPMC